MLTPTNRGEGGFWRKVKRYAKVMGQGVTPAVARTVIFGALGCLISPVDAIPDITPVVGYADDLGVLVAAVAVVGAHIKKEHRAKANETPAQWFGPDEHDDTKA